MARKSLEVGDQVHDMHDGLPKDEKWRDILSPLEEYPERQSFDVEHCRMHTTTDQYKAIYAAYTGKAGHTYVNKMLVYCGRTPDHSGFVFIYAYDGTIFGTVQVRDSDKRSMKELAEEALFIQNACNLSGLVFGLERTMRRFNALNPGMGTDKRNTHPIFVLWTDKLASLTGAQYGQNYGECYQAVETMAKGG